MRLKLKLLPRDAPTAIPLNHLPWAAFIYETISRFSGELARELHDTGLGFNSREADKHFKLFVYSVPQILSGGEVKIRDGFCWFDRGLVEWQVGSPLPELGIPLREVFTVDRDEQRTFRIGRSFFSVAAVEEVCPPVFSNQMRFVPISPLMISTTKMGLDGRRVKYYCRAQEPEFANLVVTNLLGKYRALHGIDAEDPRLEFEFDWNYVERHGGVESRKVTRLVHYKQAKIKAYQVPFIMRGNPKLIELGWESGFGHANSQGLGMADVAQTGAEATE